MTRTMTNVVKGLGTAMAIGGAVALVSSAAGGGGNKFSKRKLRKTAMKAAHTIENVLGGIQSVMQ